jgi:hypothetical protein
MRAIGRHVGQTLVALASAEMAVSRLDFLYDTWRLLAQDLGNGQLYVLCAPETDAAMLRMTVDVVATGWKIDSNVQKKLSARPRRDLLARENLDEVSWRLLNQGT